MSVNRWILLALFSLACGDGKETDEGTAVGNPGTLTMDVALSSGFSVTSAIAPVIAVTVTSIDGEEVTLLEEGDLDFLGDTLEVPEGEYTALSFEFSDNLVITGERARDPDTRFALPLFVASIELQAQGGGSVVVDDNEYGMTLGVENFMLPIDAALVTGEEIVVDDPEIRGPIEDAVRNESSAGQRGADGEQERTLRGG